MKSLLIFLQIVLVSLFSTAQEDTIDKLFRNSYRVWELQRNEIGIYRDSKLFSGDDYHPCSVANVGIGLISLCIADSMKWDEDALQKALIELNKINKNDLWVVFGCGGDRDKTKRPKMGHIASVLSNQVVFTSDNPRTEDPEVIIREVEEGVSPENFKKTVSITDRKQAIKTACQLAQPNDIILVAGKGHETYQEINGKRIDFDDYKILEEFLKQLQK